MNYIVAYGNPADGFFYVGPFTQRLDAVAYMEREEVKGDMWVLELLTPDTIEEEA
jgi:hypothetical protein